MFTAPEKEKMMRESELERKFCTAVCRAGGKAYKFVSPGNAGMPDRLVVLPGGRIGFVELKRPGEKPGKLQRRRMQELERLGCFTAVVDSGESIDLLVGSLVSGDGAYGGTFRETVSRDPYGGCHEV